METVGYKHYINDVAGEFPAVDKKAIESIVRHGLGMMVLFKKLDHDLYLNNNTLGFYFYFGQITVNRPDKFLIFFKKRIRKARLLYRLKKTIHDGYYYFMLNEEDNEKFIQKQPIEKVVMFKLKSEAMLRGKKCKYLYSIPMVETTWVIVNYNYETNDREHLQ